MELKAGKSIIVVTKTYGDVKVWNWNDTELHFSWFNGSEHGSINVKTGTIFSLTKTILDEVVAQL